MVAHASCDPQRLERLLHNELTVTEQHLLETHVEHCPHCQRHLENLAANDRWWEEASAFLSTVEPEHDRGSSSLPASKPPDNEPWRYEFTEIPAGLLSPTADPLSLGRLDEYEVLEVLGHGGMGIVVKAHEQKLNRWVAIKILAPHLATSASARQRFAREAQAAAAVVHPHVVPIHAVHASARLPYLVMQYVPGESLQQRIDRTGPLPLADTLRIVLQTARGLAAAHEQGLVHRDVKPSNILLESNLERVLLSDFGLARAADDASLTRSGVIAGTPQYMSPEQARGLGVDTRTDLFSLGSVMYAAATGHPPFRAESSMAVLNRICNEPARPACEVQPQLPAWIDALLSWMMAKEPDDRPTSAGQLADVLGQCLAHCNQPAAEPLPGIIQRRIAPPAKHPYLVGKRLLMGVAAAACLILAWPWFRQAGTPVVPASSPTPPPVVVPWDHSLQSELDAIENEIQWLEQLDEYQPY